MNKNTHEYKHESIKQVKSIPKISLPDLNPLL